MRLTIVNQFYAPDLSPTAHLATSLARHRAARGDQVTVVTSRGGYVPESARTAGDDKSNPRVHRVWTPRVGKGNLLRRLTDYASYYLLATWRMLRLPAQDVVLCMTTPPFIAWAGALHKLLHPRARLVMWSMDCYPDAAERMGVIRGGGVLSRALARVNRALFRRLDHVVCLDGAMVELLEERYASPSGRLPFSVIPNWEPAALFPAEAAPPPWAGVAALGLEGKFVVLYLGNMGFGHQFDTVLQAAEALRDAPVVFLFVGGGAQRQPLERAVRERGLHNVVLHGYVPKEETPSVLRSAGCALVTLNDLALGVMSPSKLHSNLAAGLPILYVGPRGSNVDEAVQQFGCGTSVRQGDVEGVVGFVRDLMEDPGRAAALRERARNAFDEAYCDTRTLPRFDTLFSRLRGPHPLPSEARSGTWPGSSTRAGA